MSSRSIRRELSSSAGFCGISPPGTMSKLVPSVLLLYSCMAAEMELVSPSRLLSPGARAVPSFTFMDG